MNKLYTLILTLLFSTAAMAQNLSINVDGEQWANGTTLTKIYANEAFDLMPGTPMEGKFFQYGIYPEILISTDADQVVTAKLVDEDKSSDVSFCFGGNCVFLNDMNSYTVTKENTKLEAGKPQDMQIEVKHSSAANAPYSATLSLSVTGDKGGSFNGKLVLRYDPEAANNVNSIHSANSKNTLYTLSGQAVRQASKKGIYVQNGRKVIR